MIAEQQVKTQNENRRGVCYVQFRICNPQKRYMIYVEDFVDGRPIWTGVRNLLEVIVMMLLANQQADRETAS